MPGYSDTRQLIIDTLMGRPAGTEIQPEDHQAFALALNDYIRSVELVAGSGVPVAFAEPDTVPIQPNNGQAVYLSYVPRSVTKNFVNFIDQSGNSISVTSSSGDVKLVTLLWNGSYWSSQIVTINVLSDDSSVNASNIGASDYILFSTSSNYSIGDIVRYDGKLYKFTAEHVAGAWVGTDVEPASINSILTSELTELKSEVRFYQQNNSQQDYADSYERGIRGMFIDSSIKDVTVVEMWCYNNLDPTLFCRCKTSDSDAYVELLRKSMSEIELNVPIELLYNNIVIGYVSIKDKEAFSNFLTGSPVLLNVDVITRNIQYSILKKIDDNAVTTPKIATNAVTTPKIDDNAVTIEKTNFVVEKRVNNQLYNETSMGVVGSWYYWKSIEGIGQVVTLTTNQYTDSYTAIKIPINGLNKITLTQTSGNGILQAYYIVDEEMKALDFTYGVEANLSSGYTINITSGAAYLLLSVIRYDVNSFMANEGEESLPYEPYTVNTFVNGINISENEKSLKTINISLPNKIYAVVGDTLQLFYRGIIQAVNPDNYNVVITCSKGKQYPRYFEYTPNSTDVGETLFGVTVKDDNGNILQVKTCTLVTRNVVQSPSSLINVACFGDSLTSSGVWCAEAYRRLTQIGGTPAGNGLENIRFVGSKINNGAGYFGVGGWTWYSYLIQGALGYRFQVQNVSSLSVGAEYTNNGNSFTIKEVNIIEGEGNILCSVTSLTPAPSTSGVLTKTSGTGDDTISFTSVEEDVQNPLWDVENNKMSFIPYANEVAEGSIDVVYTLLSWNGVTAWKDDFENIINQVKIFADTLHSEFPNAKMKIMGVQVPSVRGGMGANYGATGTSYADWYGMVVTTLNMNKAYQDFANEEGYSDFVEFVNVSSQFDTEYMMPHEQKDVNTRNSSTKEWIDTNGVHPSWEGYLQIADVVYRNFIANFCQ